VHPRLGLIELRQASAELVLILPQGAEAVILAAVALSGVIYIIGDDQYIVKDTQ